MTFDVDLARLQLVPHMLDNLAHAAGKCEKYAAVAFDFEFGPGAVNSASGTHADVRALVTRYFHRIAERAATLSGSITKSVTDYENADLTQAAGLALVTGWDQALPDAGRPAISRMATLDLNRPEARVRERGDPEGRLLPLTDYRPELPYEPTWTDLFSPASICRDVVIGVNWLAVQMGLADRVDDPFDFLAVPWFGNWAGMKACSDALANLSKACSELRANCGWIETRVSAVWQGNAADAAWMRLKELNDHLDRGMPILDHISAAYAVVVEDVARLEEVAEIVVGEAIDSCVCAIAAYLTAPTIVVPVALGVARTVKISESMRRLSKAGDLVTRLKMAVDVFEGKLHPGGVLDFNFELAGQLEP